MIISFTTGREIPASGGVLVGAAQVAELFLQKSAWLYAAQVAGLNSVIYRNTGFRCEDGTPFKAFHVVTYNTKKNHNNTNDDDSSNDQDHCDTDPFFNPKSFKILKTLHQNAKSCEIMKSGSWQLHATAYRIKNILNWIIIAASLLGTAIWAFAHLLEDDCCTCFLGC